MSAFDFACGIGERHEPMIAEMCRQSRLFLFDGDWHTGDFDKEEVAAIDEIHDHFSLPYDCIAIEHAYNFPPQEGHENLPLVVPAVHIIMRSGSQVAINTLRRLGEQASAKSRGDIFGPWSVLSVLDERKFPSQRDATVLMYQLEVHYTGEGEVPELYATPHHVMFISSDGYAGSYTWGDQQCRDRVTAIGPDAERRVKAWGELAASLGGSAMRSAVRLMLPHRFIVEGSAIRKPKHRRKQKKGRCAAPVPRSEERTVYMSLKPQAIREHIGLEEPTDWQGKRKPHERRAHFKRLRAERWKHKRGQLVRVKASWIGPSSGEAHGRKYQVHLD